MLPSVNGGVGGSRRKAGTYQELQRRSTPGAAGVVQARPRVGSFSPVAGAESDMRIGPAPGGATVCVGLEDAGSGGASMESDRLALRFRCWGPSLSAADGLWGSLAGGVTLRLVRRSRWFA